MLVLLTIIPSALTNSAAASVLLNVALFCMNGAVALAILKYRLYDIDIVISKALQYGALAAFITAVYAALVVGVGAAVGDQHSVYLSAVAAAVVAVAFQPVRQRAALGGQPAGLRPPRDAVSGAVGVRAPDRRCLRR